MKTQFVPYLYNGEKTDCFTSNSLYYGNSDAIADDFNTESTRPHSAAYIYLFCQAAPLQAQIYLLFFSELIIE